MSDLIEPHAQCSNDNFSDLPRHWIRYDPLRVIGVGSFGTVYLCRDCHEVAGALYEYVAVKAVAMSGLSDDEMRLAMNEISILQNIHHPNIIQFLDYFIDTEQELLCLVTEYVDGGDVGMYIRPTHDAHSNRRVAAMKRSMGGLGATRLSSAASHGWSTWHQSQQQIQQSLLIHPTNRDEDHNHSKTDCSHVSYDRSIVPEVDAHSARVSREPPTGQYVGCADNTHTQRCPVPLTSLASESSGSVWDSAGAVSFIGSSLRQCGAASVHDTNRMKDRCGGESSMETFFCDGRDDADIGAGGVYTETRLCHGGTHESTAGSKAGCDASSAARLTSSSFSSPTATAPWLTSFFIINTVRQCLEALHYLHDHGIVHRDIKASNVYLTRDGVVKLGDFGVSKLLTPAQPFTRTFIGTPFYLSPELCLGEAYDYATDIWALGVLTYEMYCLQLPFVAHNVLAQIHVITEGVYDVTQLRAPHRFPPQQLQELQALHGSDFVWKEALLHTLVVDVVEMMLTVDPHIRPAAAQLLRQCFGWGETCEATGPTRRENRSICCRDDEATGYAPDADCILSMPGRPLTAVQLVQMQRRIRERMLSSSSRASSAAAVVLAGTTCEPYSGSADVGPAALVRSVSSQVWSALPGAMLSRGAMTCDAEWASCYSLPRLVSGDAPHSPQHTHHNTNRADRCDSDGDGPDRAGRTHEDKTMRASAPGMPSRLRGVHRGNTMSTDTQATTPRGDRSGAMVCAEPSVRSSRLPSTLLAMQVDRTFDALCAYLSSSRRERVQDRPMHSPPPPHHRPTTAPSVRHRILSRRSDGRRYSAGIAMRHGALCPRHEHAQGYAMATNRARSAGDRLHNPSTGEVNVLSLDSIVSHHDGCLPASPIAAPRTHPDDVPTCSTELDAAAAMCRGTCNSVNGLPFAADIDANPMPLWAERVPWLANAEAFSALRLHENSDNVLVVLDNGDAPTEVAPNLDRDGEQADRGTDSKVAQTCAMKRVWSGGDRYRQSRVHSRSLSSANDGEGKEGEATRPANWGTAAPASNAEMASSGVCGDGASERKMSTATRLSSAALRRTPSRMRMVVNSAATPLRRNRACHTANDDVNSAASTPTKQPAQRAMRRNTDDDDARRNRCDKDGNHDIIRGGGDRVGADEATAYCAAGEADAPRAQNDATHSPSQESTTTAALPGRCLTLSTATLEHLLRQKLLAHREQWHKEARTTRAEMRARVARQAQLRHALHSLYVESFTAAAAAASAASSSSSYAIHRPAPSQPATMADVAMVQTARPTVMLGRRHADRANVATEVDGGVRQAVTRAARAAAAVQRMQRQHAAAPPRRVICQPIWRTPRADTATNMSPLWESSSAEDEESAARNADRIRATGIDYATDGSDAGGNRVRDDGNSNSNSKKSTLVWRGHRFVWRDSARRGRPRERPATLYRQRRGRWSNPSSECTSSSSSVANNEDEEEEEEEEEHEEDEDKESGSECQDRGDGNHTDDDDGDEEMNCSAEDDEEDTLCATVDQTCVMASEGEGGGTSAASTLRGVAADSAALHLAEMNSTVPMPRRTPHSSGRRRANSSSSTSGSSGSSSTIDNSSDANTARRSIASKPSDDNSSNSSSSSSRENDDETHYYEVWFDEGGSRYYDYDLPMILELVHALPDYANTSTPRARNTSALAQPLPRSSSRLPCIGQQHDDDRASTREAERSVSGDRHTHTGTLAGPDMCVGGGGGAQLGSPPPSLSSWTATAARIASPVSLPCAVGAREKRSIPSGSTKTQPCQDDACVRALPHALPITLALRPVRSTRTRLAGVVWRVCVALHGILCHQIHNRTDNDRPDSVHDDSPLHTVCERLSALDLWFCEPPHDVLDANDARGERSAALCVALRTEADWTAVMRVWRARYHRRSFMRLYMLVPTRPKSPDETSRLP